ncbi:MAG TPA: ABC transporter ATP-binding protein [Longimicrobium sp.]|nr:ABC transporter ATP-binding protein [Longimicrobium sp.]
MATPTLLVFSRWRAFLRLLWGASRGGTVAFGALVLVLGLVPTGVILLTGALVRAIPAAVEHGLGSAQGEPAVLALAGLVGALAVLSLGGNALWQLCNTLNAAYALHVHTVVARVTLGTAGVAPLEDPAFADELQAVHEAERRGVLGTTTSELSTVVLQRLRGAGAFVVLLGFAWWAPFPLALAWALGNLAYLRKTDAMIEAEMGEGASGLRRAEYLWSLALEPGAAKEVRVFGLNGWMTGLYGDAMLRALRVLWKSRRASTGAHLLAIAALLGAHAVVLGALVSAAASGELRVAALLVYIQAVIATADLGLIGDSQWDLAYSLALAERVDRLRARAAGRFLPLRPSAAPSTDAPRGQVAVRLDGVRFTYRGRGTPTLDGVDLSVPAGQSLAIVGENGAGKSTLIKLLCGLYEPEGGRVTLDGGATPLQSRGRIGVIFQDFVRYPLSLRENVGFGHLPLLNDAPALEQALADAGGAALPQRLPGGWDTPLSREFEGGADLSGGQWQRVALARALTAVRGGAGLLILDEPTASLDVRAETELFERFLEVTRGVTTILVSHRLSSVRRADRIVVLHGGRVVEDGTHEQLMRAGGRYAEMFSLQAERFAAHPSPDAEVADA